MNGVNEQGIAPTSWTVAAGRGAQMVLVVGSITAATYARFLLGPFQESIRSAMTLSDNQMALLQGPALTVLMVLAAIPLGLLIDRSSRAHLFFFLLALSLVGSLCTAMASGFYVLFVARCIVGLTGYAVNPVASSLIADLYSPAQRGRAIMFMGVGQTVGASAAFALGGAMIAASGTGPGDWRGPMAWLSVPVALAMLFALALREPERTGIVVQHSSAREAFAELWRYRSVMSTLLAGMILMEIALGASLIWAAPSLSRIFDLAPERISAIMAIALLASGFLGPVMGGLLADFAQRTGGPRQAILAMGVLALLSGLSALFVAMPTVAASGAMLALFLTFVSATTVMGSTLMTIVLPNELRGLGIGLLMASALIFVGFAPLIVSMLSVTLGGHAMIGKALAIVCVTACLLGAATFALGRRYFHRTAEQ